MLRKETEVGKVGRLELIRQGDWEPMRETGLGVENLDGETGTGWVRILGLE